MRRALLRSLLAVAALAAALPVRAQVRPGPPGAAATPDPNALFNNAVAAFDAGDYQKAVTNINALFGQIPADLPAADKVKLTAQLEPLYFTLGASYFNLKEWSRAGDAFKDYLTRYPRGGRVTEARFSLAQALYFGKDLGRDLLGAAAAFAALENEPAYREQALLFEGLSYKEAEKTDEAITALEKLAAGGIHTPAAARGEMQLISLYAKKGQRDKTLKVLADLQANLTQVENVAELNTVALEQGDAFLEGNAGKEALACYRVVRTRGEVVALQRERLAALGRRLEATRTALRANPRQAAQYALAIRQLQDSVAATQAAVEGFEKLPDIRPQLLYRMGRAFTLQGRPWESIVVYTDALAASKEPAEREPALYALAAAYAEANRPADARETCNEYLKTFPQGPNAFTVGYMLGASALQQNDSHAAEGYFGRMLEEQPGSNLAGEMRFLLGNAKFDQGKYDEARGEYIRYQKDFPDGPHKEETIYRVALGTLFAGKYEEALRLVEDYLRQYPNAAFVTDARYRRLVCLYAGQRYDEVTGGCQDWLRQYPSDAQAGEVLGLLGDAQAAAGKSDDALAAYRRSFKTATTDEVLNYSLLEAAKILQKRGQWKEIGEMFEGFVREHPDHPTVPTAMYWIARAKTKEGKVDEAKQILADNIKKYIHDCHREGVDGLLDQLAALCVRKKPAVPAASPGGSPTSPAAPADPAAELDTLLGDAGKNSLPTARARVLYAKAQLARLRRQDADANRQLVEIGTHFHPSELSPVLLGQVGDALVDAGKLDEAVPFYRELMEVFPKSDTVDFAYNGLGEIALRKKKYDEALGYFEDGLNKIAAALKLKDLTLGRARALLGLSRYDDAKKGFEQVAATKEWRGEATAASVYSLGEIEARQGRWAEANAYYQRVYVAYQRFLPWVARAYLGSGESLEKLGKTQDAINTYHEMLRNEKLAALPEAVQARERLKAMGAG